jgi:hypothetical protein
MVLPVPTGVAQKAATLVPHTTNDAQKAAPLVLIPPPLHKKQQRCLTPPTVLKKAATVLPHSTNGAQKAATVVPGGSNVGGGGINGFLVADGDQPLSVAWRRIGRVPARRPAHFFASPKKWQERRPAEPVVCFAADCLALLTTGGRRRTRGLRPLRQLRRTSPVAPLLSGSEGAFSRHRAFTERRGSSTSLFALRVRAKWMRLLPYPTVGCRVTPYGLIRPTMLFNAFRFSLFAFLIDNTCPC